jgi:hypothetical protein
MYILYESFIIFYKWTEIKKSGNKFIHDHISLNKGMTTVNTCYIFHGT